MPHSVNTPLNHPITEDDIAHYLRDTPAFFERQAQLLSTVQLHSPHSKRTVSLQERQAEMLREKNKGLEQRFMEMIRNGNENVLLSDKILRWAHSLLRTTDVLELPEKIVLELTLKFGVPQVALRVWNIAPEHAGMSIAKAVSGDAKVFASSLVEPYCGLNTGFEAVSWLEDPIPVESLALMALRPGATGSTEPAFGMLVLASPDPYRFNSTMGTEFLSRIGEIASAALSRLRPPPKPMPEPTPA